ncbi:type II secretion system protein GspH [Azoarcus sp. DD4]|uniref:GspH/FimT family protein n=1 Tax=Azoarcus sp. DD4 TaxID=2027405 RepID=UPI00112DD529|nr:GspH/FimT family protein [Azoarcus sp. DD4]QDF95610.1 type II secretion system protein GspH [Azoarcus sp. DD4]
MRGFTLVELVVALAIAALALGAVAANHERLLQTMAYRSAVRGVLAGMHAARTEAMRSGRPVVFAVDLAGRSYGVDGRLGGRLPEAVGVRVIVAEREVEAAGKGGIRFQPDGGATGGSVDLLRPQGGGVRLRVDWLFGRIEQEPIPG